MQIFDYLESLPWFIGAVVIVGIFVILTVIGISLVRKLFPPHTLKVHHDVAGFVFANIGVIYAVLLGFTVVSAQQRFDKIKETAEVEASLLAQLYRDAEVFPEKDKHTIRNYIKSYGESVLREEWASLTEGKISQSATRSIKEIWNAYYLLEPASEKQKAWYAESISKLNQLMNARLLRILGSRESLGAEMWSFLIMGGLLLVAFIGFFGLESTTTHLLMASILAASIAFLLFLIYSLDTAFSGEISVSPDAFINVISSFD